MGPLISNLVMLADFRTVFNDSGQGTGAMVGGTF